MNCKHGNCGLCEKRAAWSGLFLVLDDGETFLCGDCCPIFAASRDVRPDDASANVWRTDSTGWTSDVYCSGCGDPIIEVEP